MTKAFLSESDIDRMAKSLADKCRSYVKDDTTLVAIERGGVPIGLRLALDLGRPLTTIRISCYTGEQKRDKPIVDLRKLEEITDKRLLIIDDLVDSGSTIECLQPALQRLGFTYKVGVLFYKPTSTVEPDYWIEQTTDWIVFPWEQE